MNALASSFLSGSLTLTDNNGFVLDEFQFAEAGRVNEENVLLHVDPVGLVDVAKHVHSGGQKKKLGLGFQCSGSTGSTCFWASRIRIH
jgi:hypothetical protein